MGIGDGAARIHQYLPMSRRLSDLHSQGVNSPITVAVVCQYIDLNELPTGDRSCIVVGNGRLIGIQGNADCCYVGGFAIIILNRVGKAIVIGKTGIGSVGYCSCS